MVHVFRKRKDDGTPVILDYEDAFFYLEPNPNFKEFSIKNAIALHVFHMRLRKSMADREFDTGERMTRDQIDEYIRFIWGADDLEGFKVYAGDALDAYVKSIHDQHVRAIIEKHEELTKKSQRLSYFPGVIIGLLGNGATLFVGYLIGVGYAIWKNESVVIGTLAYLNKCFNANITLP